MAKQLFKNPFGAKFIRHGQLTVRIISSTAPGLHSGPSDLKDILYLSCSEVGDTRILAQINGKDYIIWAQEALDSACWTLEQAHTHLEHYFYRKQSDATVVLFTCGEPLGDKAVGYKAFMISVMSLTSEAAKSCAISFQDRQALEDSLSEDSGRRSEARRSYIKKNRAFIIAGLILLVLGVTLTAVSYLARPIHKSNNWIKWVLPKDSHGPQNQLQYTWPHPNFTSWSVENNHNVDDFYLRLDDQTLIPTEYVTDWELQYQAWYAKHYPWYAEVGNSKAYLNESYWRDTRSFPLAVDQKFHVAHCVLTMKRYWKAKESNHHICPRDLDHNHIEHCFGVLESYVLDSFDTEEHNPIDTWVNGTELMWIVSACF